MNIRKITALIAAAGLTAGLSACSVVSTEPDMVALHYNGGPMSSKTFSDCVNASTREVNGAGDTYYEYPTSLRTYDASNDPGAESKPITVVSRDNAEMYIPVSVTFTVDTKCETLKEFHEEIGNRYKAYWGGSDFEDGNNDGVPDGWVNLLNFYVGKDLDTMLDRASQGFDWRQLWNDPATKLKMEAEVEKNLGAAIDDRMGGSFFNITTVRLQKPDPVNVELKSAVAAEQAAVAKAKAAEIEANAQKVSAVAKAQADQAAAEANIAVAKAQAAQQAEQIRVLGVDGYLKKYAIDNGVTPWPNPVVAGTAATREVK